VIVAVLMAVSASVYQSWATGAPGMYGWVQTQWGPIGPADRDLLEKVRLAGLWEGPTAEQAQQQASSAEVKEVGRKLAEEHAQLDEEVRSVANQLGVLLPSAPSAQQNAWMDEISSETGSDYDRVFVQRLREAHAQVLPVISEVRATTQNDLVREFAITSAEFVNRHHEYLESTGLVDYAALPHHGPGLFGGGTEMSDLLIPFLVFVAALLAAIALFWALRNRPSAPGRRERITMPPPQPQHSPRLPELAAVAAIPAPRHIGLDETGPIPVTSDVTVSGTDTGPHRWSPRADTDSGAHGAVRTKRSRTAVADMGSHNTLTDSGPHRAVTDTGSERAISDPDSDSGSHRAVSTSGSHRMPRSRRARHSMRR
jgi:predicted outer membrane protein